MYFEKILYYVLNIYRSIIGRQSSLTISFQLPRDEALWMIVQTLVVPGVTQVGYYSGKDSNSETVFSLVKRNTFPVAKVLRLTHAIRHVGSKGATILSLGLGGGAGRYFWTDTFSRPCWRGFVFLPPFLGQKIYSQTFIGHYFFKPWKENLGDWFRHCMLSLPL